MIDEDFFCYNHVPQKLQPCVPELQAVYTRATTGDTRCRRGCNRHGQCYNRCPASCKRHNGKLQTWWVTMPAMVTMPARGAATMAASCWNHLLFVLRPAKNFATFRRRRSMVLLEPAKFLLQLTFFVFLVAQIVILLEHSAAKSTTTVSWRRRRRASMGCASCWNRLWPQAPLGF